MYDKIKKLIKLKRKDIDDETLTYFTNYFYTLVIKNVLPKSVDIEVLIDQALAYAKKVVYYDENHPIYKKYGPDVKGVRDEKTKILFVRANLGEPLREMTVYHELHHAAQTNAKNNQVGICQESNIGRLIMEAQTQYFCEEVYKTVHETDFKEREIPSEEVRMIKGGTVVSKLHNYELYDAMLTKLAIFLDVPKEFFVTINFLYNNDEGLKILEARYNKRAQELGFGYSFMDLLYLLDYIYVVDYEAYKSGIEKPILLNGKTTPDRYEIHPMKGEQLSLFQEFKKVEEFDENLFLCLIDNNIDCHLFVKYMVSNHQRKVASDYIDDIPIK